MGGLYTATALVTWDINGTGYRIVYIEKNGTALLGACNLPQVAATCNPGLNVTPCDFTLVAGDYIELYVQQSSGGALNVNTATLSLRWIGVS